MGCLPEAVVVDTGDAFVYVWKTNEILSLYHTKKKDPASLEKNNITIFQKKNSECPFRTRDIIISGHKCHTLTECYTKCLENCLAFVVIIHA